MDDLFAGTAESDRAAFQYEHALALEHAGRFHATGISESRLAVQIGGPVRFTRHDPFVFHPYALRAQQETGPSSQDIAHVIQMRLHLQHMRERRSTHTHVPRDIRQRRRRADRTSSDLQGLESEQYQSRRESEQRLEATFRASNNVSLRASNVLLNSAEGKAPQGKIGRWLAGSRGTQDRLRAADVRDTARKKC